MMNKDTEYIVTADSHIGSISDSYIEKNGLERSVNEVFRQLDSIIDYAIQRKKTKDVVILHNGDLFDDNHPAMRYIRMLIERLNRLEENAIHIFLLVGNHDANNAGDSALSPIVKIKYKYIHVVSNIESYQNNKLNFIFIPHLVKSQFAIKDRDDFKEFIENHIKEKTSELIRPECSNIICGHLQYKNALTGSEERMLKGGINFFPDIEKSKIKLVLLGHIHKRQILKYGKIPIFYSGGIKYEDFDERNDDKGFLTFDSSLEVEFKDLEVQKFKQIEVDLVTKDTIDLDEVKVKKSVNGKIIKLIINMSEGNKNKININEIYEIFSKYCFVSKMERNIVKSNKKKIKVQTYSPKEIFKAYVDKNVKEIDKKDVLKHGLDILEEVS